MIQLFPPGAFVIAWSACGPMRWKRVAFNPVKDVKRDACVSDVHDGPDLKVVKAREKTDQKTNCGYDADVKRPRGGGVEPFHTYVVGLRSVTSLHGEGERYEGGPMWAGVRES
eukprot:GFKZ01000777.1.p2 GENE.GFKZ01000777.1~~GFKZ01000777.1.p2  ORF type:complete len:113 (+),score=7.22 GFKZ01000777.1:641-979(+)